MAKIAEVHWGAGRVFRAFLAGAMSLSFTFSTLPVAQAQQVIVDPSLPSVQLLNSGNGTPQINIATPQGGVSLNKFSKFNVGPNNLILNNSASDTTSQLGGAVAANPNLTAGNTATVIVNEVTGSGSTLLTGTTEVAGDQADVVIANPNGVTCNGCAFVATPNATITTGTPTVTASGVELSVSKGSVVVGNSGLTAEQGANVIGRHVTITGPVQAGANSELVVSGGSQHVNLADGTVTPAPVTEAKTSPFAVDASKLGAMSAGQITIIGNETGLGVNSYGQVNAGGDVRLTSKGDLFVGDVTAGGQVTATATGAMRQYGDVTATGDVTVAADSVTVYQDTTLKSDGKVTIETDSFVVIAGEIDAADIELNVGTGLSNSGFILSDESLLIVAGESVVNQREIATEYDVATDPALQQYIAAYQQQLLDGGEEADIAAEMLARAANNVVVNEYIDRGASLTGTDVTVQAGQDVQNIGGLVAATNDVRLTAASNIINDIVVTRKTLTTAEGCPTETCGYRSLMRPGEVLAGGDLFLNADLNVENRASHIAAHDNVTVTAGLDIINDIRHSDYETNRATTTFDQAAAWETQTIDLGGKDGTQNISTIVTRERELAATDKIVDQVLAPANIVALTGDVDVEATRDFLSIGSEISAGRDLNIVAGDRALMDSHTGTRDQYLIYTQPYRHVEDHSKVGNIITVQNRTVVNADISLKKSATVLVGNNINVVAENDIIATGVQALAANNVGIGSNSGSVLVDSADLPDRLTILGNGNVEFVEPDQDLATQILADADLTDQFKTFLQTNPVLTSVAALKQAGSGANIKDAARAVGVQGGTSLLEGNDPDALRAQADANLQQAYDAITQDIAALDQQAQTIIASFQGQIDQLSGDRALVMDPPDPATVQAAIDQADADKATAIATAEQAYTDQLAQNQADYGHLLTTTTQQWVGGDKGGYWQTVQVPNQHYINLKNAADAQALTDKNTAIQAAETSHQIAIAAAGTGDPATAAAQAARVQADVDRITTEKTTSDTAATVAYDAQIEANRLQYEPNLYTTTQVWVEHSKVGGWWETRTVVVASVQAAYTAANNAAAATRDAALAENQSQHDTELAVAQAEDRFTTAALDARAATLQQDLNTALDVVENEKATLNADIETRVAEANAISDKIRRYEAAVAGLDHRALALGTVVMGQESFAKSITAQEFPEIDRLDTLAANADGVIENTSADGTGAVISTDKAVQDSFMNATAWRFATDKGLSELFGTPKSVIHADGDNTITAGEDAYFVGDIMVTAGNDLRIEAGRRVGLLGAINSHFRLNDLSHQAFTEIGETLQKGTLLIDPEVEGLDETQETELLDTLEDDAPSLTYAEQTQLYSLTTTALASGADLTVAAGEDVINFGGSVIAQENLIVTAENDIRNEALRHNFTLTAADGCVGRACGGQGHDYKPAEMLAGSGMLMVAGNDIRNHGGVISSAGGMMVQAENDIVNSALTSQYLYYYVKKLGWFTGKKKILHRAIIQEGQFVTEFGTLSVDAGNDLISEGSQFSSGSDIVLTAGRDVVMSAKAEELHNYLKLRGFGWFYYQSESQRWNEFETAIAEVEGNTITINADRNIIGVGTSLVASGDIDLTAGEDLNIDAHQNIKYHKRSGWSIGVSFSGSQILAAALSGDLEGAFNSFMASNPALAAVHKLATSDDSSGTMNGMMALLYHGGHAANRIQNGAPVGGETSVGQAIASEFNPFSDLMDQNAAFTGSDKDSYLSGFMFRFGVFQSKREWTESYISRVVSGNDLTIQANKDVILAGGVVASATQDLTVYAGDNVFVSALADWSKSFESDWGFSFGFSNAGYTIGSDYSQATSSSQLYTNAAITAGRDLFMVSGERMTFAGANVRGGNVYLEAGEDLVVQSRQNTSESNSFGFDVSVTFSVTGISGASASVHYSDANRVYTDTPTWIVAEDHLSIYVEDTTYLLGAMMNSETGNLHLSTADFVFDNYHDEDRSMAFAAGVSYGASGFNGHLSFSYSETQALTFATIGEGEIELRDWNYYDFSALNRDVNNVQRVTSQTSFGIEIPGFDLKGMVDGFHAVDNIFTAVTAEIPDEIRSSGEEHVNLFQQSLLSGVSLESAREKARNGDYHTFIDMKKSIENMLGKKDAKFEELTLEQQTDVLMLADLGGTLTANGDVVLPCNLSRAINSGCVATIDELRDVFAEKIKKGLKAKVNEADATEIFANSSKNRERIARFFTCAVLRPDLFAQIVLDKPDLIKAISRKYGNGENALHLLASRISQLSQMDYRQRAKELDAALNGDARAMAARTLQSFSDPIIKMIEVEEELKAQTVATTDGQDIIESPEFAAAVAVEKAGLPIEEISAETIAKLQAMADEVPEAERAAFLAEVDKLSSEDGLIRRSANVREGREFILTSIVNPQAGGELLLAKAGGWLFKGISRTRIGRWLARKTGGCSFHGDTLVLAKQGYIAIRDLQVGQNLVWSRDAVTGEMDWKPVQALFVDSYDETVRVSMRNLSTGVEQTIVSNRIHPFFVQVSANENVPMSSEGHRYNGRIKNGHWVDAANLRVGYRLLQNDGSWAEVSRVDIRRAQIDAWNITVRDFHTYFVAGNDVSAPVWVHNDCFDDKKIFDTFGGRKKFHRAKSNIKTDFRVELDRTSTRNPDIGMDDAGNIIFRDPRTKRVVLRTDVPLESYVN